MELEIIHDSEAHTEEEKEKELDNLKFIANVFENNLKINDSDEVIIDGLSDEDSKRLYTLLTEEDYRIEVQECEEDNEITGE